MRSLKPRDLATEHDTFMVAMYCYFGMSDHAIIRNVKGMNKHKIAYRLKKIREWYGIDIRRWHYRNGQNQLARRVIVEFGPFAKKKLLLNDLK